MNACPQLQPFNGGIWHALERKISEDWSEEFGPLWIVCGPVFRDELGRKLPGQFIGDGDEVRVAVPQYFYKIVARLSASDPNRPEVLAYLFPHDAALSSGAKDQDLSRFLVSVNTLELLTDLDFFANLPGDVEAAVELRPADEEWPLRSP